MSKKILVMVENDWTVREKIYDRIHGKQFGGFSKIDTQQASQIINEMFAVLADYKLDAIEFKAEVDIPLQYAIASKGHLDTIIHLITKDKIPAERYDKFHVFLLKPKKPEVKDEREQT